MKKIPTIILSITYKGVKFIDASNKVSFRCPEADVQRDKTGSPTCLGDWRSYQVAAEATAGPEEPSFSGLQESTKVVMVT